MKKILITGGAGFVGRYFTKYFLDQKYEVHVVDNIAQHTGAKDPNKIIKILFSINKIAEIGLFLIF